MAGGGDEAPPTKKKRKKAREGAAAGRPTEPPTKYPFAVDVRNQHHFTAPAVSTAASSDLLRLSRHTFDAAVLMPGFRLPAQLAPWRASPAASGLTFDSHQAADHCETPAEAYEDVAPLLTALVRADHTPAAAATPPLLTPQLHLCSQAGRLGKSKAELRIYDPFYCQGRSERRSS